MAIDPDANHEAISRRPTCRRCPTSARRCPMLSAHLLAVGAERSSRPSSTSSTAVPGLLLHANDAPDGTTPPVFSLQVQSDGTLVAVPVSLGTGARRWMNAAPYHVKFAKALARQGDLYTLQDILDRLADGRMQSFAENNSWMITQISNFPRRRVLEVIAAGRRSRGLSRPGRKAGAVRQRDEY